MSQFRTTKREMLQELVESYRRIHGQSSVNLQEVAAWAVREKIWQMEPRSRVRILSRALADALRESYIEDAQGRRVRLKHAQRVWRGVADGKQEQLVLWHDIREASRAQMQAAFQQRRQGIVMDCHQLRQDVDSYNENFNKSVPIQMLFDFREDLEDLAHATA